MRQHSPDDVFDVVSICLYSYAGTYTLVFLILISFALFFFAFKNTIVKLFKAIVMHLFYTCFSPILFVRVSFACLHCNIY